MLIGTPVAVVTKSAITSGWIIRKIYTKLSPDIQKKFAHAISKGIVPPQSSVGIIKLTSTEAAEYGYKYTHKLKILGKGGDLRIYGTMQENGHIVFEHLTGH